MKLPLYESGIQNIRKLAKQYNTAWLYTHCDSDGLLSGIAMKEYLAQYGIKVVKVQKIQYGSTEYEVEKAPDNVLPVLTDFSHGKFFMKIHTDHHDSQIKYNAASNFKHSKSNAGTISSTISPKDIFPSEDVRAINMIDSAGYADEGIGIEELKNYIIQYKKENGMIHNHLRFGMVVGKLIDALKNKPNFIEQIILNSNPSMVSIFRNIIGYINDNGLKTLDQMQANSEKYAARQKDKQLPSSDIDSIDTMPKGTNTVIGDCILQIDGATGGGQGGYNRYTVFKVHPEAKYCIKIWSDMGLMQVSKNNWNKDVRSEKMHLGHLVINEIFDKKYKEELSKKFYNISLLAIKKTLEKNIERNDTPNAIGFNYDDFIALFGELDITEKQKAFIEKCMKLKPSELRPSDDDNEKQIERKMKVLKFLNDFSIPLYDIVMKNSGGHPGITNLTGFEFLDTQRKIFGALKHDRNPYNALKKDEDKPRTSYKPDPNKPVKDKAGFSLMRKIAKDVVKMLNSGILVESEDKLTYKYDIGTILATNKDKVQLEVIGHQVSWDKKPQYKLLKNETGEIYSWSEYALDNYCFVLDTKVNDDGEWLDENVELTETKPSRFNQHLDNPNSFANISAERSLVNSPFKDMENKAIACLKLKEWNNKRTKELEKLLKQMGLRGYFRVRGGYVEIGSDPNYSSEEKSFFIPNITKEQAIELGAKFDQDSVLFKDKNEKHGHYYYTNTSDGHKIGGKDDLTFHFNQGRYNSVQGEFYTRLPNRNHKFSYNTDDESNNIHAHKSQDFINNKY